MKRYSLLMYDTLKQTCVFDTIVGNTDWEAFNNSHFSEGKGRFTGPITKEDLEFLFNRIGLQISIVEITA